MVVRPTSAAHGDLVAAHDWYEKRSQGLGKEFVRMVDAAFSVISRDPALFPPVYQDLRRVLVRRFPYSVFYRIEPDSVQVVAVLHTAMDRTRLTGRI